MTDLEAMAKVGLDWPACEPCRPAGFSILGPGLRALDFGFGD